jgi:hypothetical protein
LEIMGKTAMLIAPFSKEDACDAIARSGAIPLLSGYRGGVNADLDGLAALAVKVCAFARALGPRVEILDLNPVIINGQFRAGCVADARLFMKEV